MLYGILASSVDDLWFLLLSFCTEENNRMGKIRDLFKKTEPINETFHAKIGTVKERMVDLTEAEEIKERWQEYTELY